MALMADQHGERTEMPTPMRLDDARRRGQVPRSSDLVCVAVLTGGLAALAFLGEGLFVSLREMTARGLSEAGQHLSPAEALRIPWAGVRPVTAGALGFAAIVVIVAALANLVQFGWVFSSEAVKPQLGRINPTTGLKRILSARSFVRGLLSVAKVAAVAGVVTVALPGILRHTGTLATDSLTSAASQAGALAWRLSLWLIAVLALLAVVDLLYQRWQYRRDLRITRRELLDDLRRMEGDPKFARYRRRMAEKLAQPNKPEETSRT